MEPCLLDYKPNESCTLGWIFVSCILPYQRYEVLLCRAKRRRDCLKLIPGDVKSQERKVGCYALYATVHLIGAPRFSSWILGLSDAVSTKVPTIN